MNQGRIEQIGKPTEVYNRPATRFVATFIGSPAMNLVPGRVAGRGKVEIAGSGTLLFDADLFEVADGTTVEVGVRPEDMSVAAAGEGSGFSIMPEFVEELGPNRLVHGLAGGAPLVLSVPSSMRDLGKGKIALVVPEARVHVFDTTTGRALRQR
jgi:sn-glycerol 3-phosphate transport system ATP-binding protein